MGRITSVSVLILLFLANAPAPASDREGCPDILLQAGVAPAIERPSTSGFSVVSLNLARETRADRIIDAIRANRLRNADVWMLQEAANRLATGEKPVEALAQALGLHYVFAPADLLDEGKLVSGLAVMSRFPIEEWRLIRLPHHDLKFNTRCRIALEATIHSPRGKARFYNLHLDTRISKDERLDQIRPVLNAIGETSDPTVVAGDFNSANFGWLWNVFPVPYAQNHARPLRELFLDQGFASPLDGIRGSFKILWMWLRLDWIFTKGLASTSFGVENIDFSDHEAVWTELAWPEDSRTSASIEESLR
jgi:endonuclease/exonuclease/phosphatase family metal-dependent hydrolase